MAKQVVLRPPYDRRCAECESIGGHAVWCSQEVREDETEPVLARGTDHGDWVVSKGWVWFPGIFDSRDAAELAAVQYSEGQVEELWRGLDTPRPITLDDLWAYEERQ